MTPESSATAGRPSIAEIERWLVEQLAAELAIDPAQIDVHQPVAAYGIDSMQVVTLLAQLEDRLGFRFAANPLEEHPTIAALARFAATHRAPIQEREGEAPAEPLV